MPRALHAPRPGDVTELTALLAQSRLTVSQTLYSQGHGTCGTSNYTTAHRLYKSIQYDHSPSRRCTSRAALRPERNARLAARPAPVRSPGPAAGASHAGVRDRPVSSTCYAEPQGAGAAVFSCTFEVTWFPAQRKRTGIPL